MSDYLNKHICMYVCLNSQAYMYRLLHLQADSLAIVLLHLIK